MKKLSIEEKQKVYEYLLNKDCPDLLAALVAERSEETVEWHQSIADDEEPLTIGDVLGGAFYWDASPEGDEFWRTLWKEIKGYPEDEEVDDEDTKYKIEVDTSLLLPALAQSQAQVNEASEKLLVIPQPEREGLVFKLFEYKYHIGILCSIVVGATVGLRYTGVI